MIFSFLVGKWKQWTVYTRRIEGSEMAAGARVALVGLDWIERISDSVTLRGS